MGTTCSSGDFASLTENTIQVYRIDTYRSPPSVKLLTQISYPARPAHDQAVDLILGMYTAANKFNVKCFIHGPRSVDKNHIGTILKTTLEKRYPGHVAQLFDNFDPTVVGVNVQKMVLERAGPDTPVILMINDIDVAYRDALAPANRFDPRLLHTMNVQSFYAMLDAIGYYRNVITIYISDKGSDELIQENMLFRWFMRAGRVDMFLHMVDDNGTIDEHKAYQ